MIAIADSQSDTNSSTDAYGKYQTLRSIGKAYIAINRSYVSEAVIDCLVNLVGYLRHDLIAETYLNLTKKAK